MPQETVRVLRLREDASTVQCKKYSIRSYQAHYHRFYEIELIVSGSGTHLLNGTSYPLRPGLMYLLRPTDVHELIIDDTATVHLIQVPEGLLSDQLLQALRLYRSNLVAQLPEASFMSMDNLCALMEEQKDSSGPYQAHLMENLLSSIILYFLRHVESAHLSRLPGQRVREILSYMQTHFTEEIGIECIADQFYLSKNYLCSLFMKETGMTVLQYLRELRLEHAAHLSMTTGMRSIEICEACGYQSVSNFLRDFKRKYHISPLQMRAHSRT